MNAAKLSSLESLVKFGTSSGNSQKKLPFQKKKIGVSNFKMNKDMNLSFKDNSSDSGSFTVNKKQPQNVQTKFLSISQLLGGC